ncbi:MAG: hypothetical protein ACQETE_11700 [Bacteroidota bacterium]
MQVSKNERLNVVATFASFKQEGISRKITPVRFVRENGEVFRVDRVQRTYMERVGDTTYVHFVVRTEGERFFDIVFNNKKMSWVLLLELDDGNSLLNNKEA